MKNLIEFDCNQNLISLFVTIADPNTDETVINFLTDSTVVTVDNSASTSTTVAAVDGVAQYTVPNELLTVQGSFTVASDGNTPIEFVIENNISSNDLVGVSQSGYTITYKTVSTGGGGTVTVGWDDITGKPETYPPSTHSHNQSDITGLEDALNGKANTDLSNVNNDVFKSKAEAAGVGGGAVSWDDVQNKPTTFPPSSHSHAISDVTGLENELYSLGEGVDGLNSQVGQLGTTINQLDQELYDQGESISGINQTLTQFSGLISNKMDVPTNTGSSNQWLKRSSGTQGTWASLPNASSSQAGLMSTSHYSKVDRIGNYVIGSGSWGDWYYKLYNDNWLECWINVDVSGESCTTSLGGGFYRTANLYTRTAHNYPWEFVDYPHIQAVYITTNNASGLIWFNPTTSYLKTNLPEMYIVRPVSSSNLNGYISFHVCGKCNYS